MGLLNTSQNILAPSSVARAVILQQAAEHKEEFTVHEDIKKSTSKEGLWRLLSATMAILNHTHTELDRANANLAALEKRVQLLETLASTDTMTGLKNRRGFEEAFSQEMDRTNRGLSQGGVMVLIDLDNFKAINDTHSHLAGDACLKLVAHTLANDVRVMDTAARLGGDEFVLLLGNATRDDVLERIQMLVWQLNNLSLIWEGTEIPVRASIGIKTYSKGESSEDIFREADIALYQNKHQRKERVAA